MPSKAGKGATERLPASLRRSGRALWKAILAEVPSDSELDQRELALLERACSCADRIADLDALVKRDGLMTLGSAGQSVLHPAVSEARQQKLVLLRLLSALNLNEAAEETPGVRQARLAARARWNRQRNVRALREVGR